MVRPKVFVIFVAVLTDPGPGVLRQLLKLLFTSGFPIFYLVNTAATANVWITAIIVSETVI